jgi:hypothetical protein
MIVYEMRTYTLHEADRRAHWAAVYANRDFVDGFATKFRPLVASQEVKLLTAAPWGPHP